MGRQLGASLWGASVGEEVEAELDFHVEMLTRELMGSGLPRSAAVDEARRRFGDLRQLSDSCRQIGESREREMRRSEYLRDIMHDLTVAARQLLRARGFAAIAILTLALGVGATTAIFSITDAVVLRALPFPEPERIVTLNEVLRGQPDGASGGDFHDWRTRAGSVLEHVAAGVMQTGFTVTGGDTPELLGGARVSAEFFAVFAVPPMLGRTFSADEDQPGRANVVVLSEQLWKRRFAGDRAALGRTLTMNGVPYTVIGVMPRSFDVASFGDELWVPLALTAEQLDNRRSTFLRAVGRLRGGVSRQGAQSALSAIATDDARRFPDTNANLTFVVNGYADSLVGGYRTRLLILLGAVGLVLLIACVNVANLLLARGAVRAKEFAIRAALGAGRARIVRQLLTESVLLGAAGMTIGLALAYWLVRGLVAISPENVPRLDQARIDGRVLAFTLLVSLVCSVLFGLAPAIRAARGNLEGTLREGGRGSMLGAGRDRLRGLLVSAEVALAIMLLAGAGLLIRSAILLQRVAPGFDPRGVATARMILPDARYHDAPRVADTYRRIRDEVANIPGVTVSALSSVVPMSGSQTRAGIGAADEPDEPGRAIATNFRMVSPRYFAALGVPMRGGRDFTERDDAAAPLVAIINESLARKLWPGRDAVGQQLWGIRGAPGAPRPKLAVVGVVGDLHDASLDGEVAPEFYIPVPQTPAVLWTALQRSLVIVAKTANDASALEHPLRKAVMRVDPSLPLAEVRTMEQLLAGTLETARFNTLLLAALGFIALVLASVGIYGVISYFVSQRTQEIGVRMALGATPSDVVRLVVRRGLTPVLIGAAVGLVLAASVTRVLSAQLYRVSATDPLTFIAVVLALVCVALVASYIPARRATRVDPLRAINVGG